MAYPTNLSKKVKKKSREVWNPDSWIAMLNELLLWVVVLRGIFLGMFLFSVTHGDFEQENLLLDSLNPACGQ